MSRSRLAIVPLLVLISIPTLSALPCAAGSQTAVLGGIAAPPPGLYKHLAGTWRLVGHPDPSSQVPDFVNYLTITQDGKLINTDPMVGAGVGETRRLQGRDYAVGFFGFLEIEGNIFSYEVQATVESASDRTYFAGPFRTLVRDLDGNLAFEYEGVVEATRLPEPLGY